MPDAPSTLPVEHLSLSSIRTFMSCPEKWRRTYIEREYLPPNGKMILGSSAGAAEAQHYSQVIETGEGFTTEQVLDEFSAEWEDRIGREEIDWGSDSPGDLKDSGASALDLYHSRIAPEIVPTSVERGFTLRWPEIDWSVIGFLDLEEADGSIGDLKMKGKRMSERDAREDLQPTLYMAARRAEGHPAPRFRFHTMIRSRKPSAEIVEAHRSSQQLDHFTTRVFAVARDIAWRTETGNWIGAPPNTWFCGFCGAIGCQWRLG